jgi:hypothetical protein
LIVASKPPPPVLVRTLRQREGGRGHALTAARAAPAGRQEAHAPQVTALAARVRVCVAPAVCPPSFVPRAPSCFFFISVLCAEGT